MKENYLLQGPLEYTNEPYAVAKIAGIKMCESYNLQYDTNYLTVMPTNTYGPNDSYDLENCHALPALIRKFHLAKLASQDDWDGIQRDELIFDKIPRDIKTDLSFEASRPNTRNSIINNKPTVRLWGSGNPQREFIYSEDLADMIKQVVGFESNTIYDSTKPDGTMRKLLDVRKLNKLGWKSNVSLRDGLQKTYANYLTKSSMGKV